MIEVSTDQVVAAFAKERLRLAAQDAIDDRQRLMFAGRVSNYIVVLTDSGLLGYSEAKAPLPGETWLRGRDLHDGPLEQRTLDLLMAQIREREGAIH